MEQIGISEGATASLGDATVLDAISTITREVETIRALLENPGREMQRNVRKRQRLEADIADVQDNHDTTQQLTDILFHDKKSLEQKLAEKEKMIEDLQRQKSQHEQKIHKLELKLATADVKKQQKLKDKLKLVKQEKRELVEQIEAQQKEIKQLKNKKSKLLLRLNKAQIDQSELQSQLKQKKSQLSKVQKKSEHLQNEWDELKRQLREKEEAMNEIFLQLPGSQELSQMVSVAVDVVITK